MSILNDLLVDVASERHRQDELFGDQSSVPDVQEPGNGTSWPSARYATHLYEKAQEVGQLSFAHILHEEFAEALDAKSDEERVTELIQVAAVALLWAEVIKRR